MVGVCRLVTMIFFAASSTLLATASKEKSIHCRSAEGREKRDSGCHMIFHRKAAGDWERDIHDIPVGEGGCSAENKVKECKYSTRAYSAKPEDVGVYCCDVDGCIYQFEWNKKSRSFQSYERCSDILKAVEGENRTDETGDKWIDCWAGSGVRTDPSSACYILIVHGQDKGDWYDVDFAIPYGAGGCSTENTEKLCETTKEDYTNNPDDAGVYCCDVDGCGRQFMLKNKSNKNIESVHGYESCTDILKAAKGKK